jgi:hypothetical protein
MQDRFGGLFSNEDTGRHKGALLLRGVELCGLRIGYHTAFANSFVACGGTAAVYRRGWPVCGRLGVGNGLYCKVVSCGLATIDDVVRAEL